MNDSDPASAHATKGTLHIAWGIDRAAVPADGELLDIAELRREVVTGRVVTRFFRYSQVVLFTPRFAAAPQPFKVCLVARFLSRGRVLIRELQHDTPPLAIGLFALCALAWQWLCDLFTRGSLLDEIAQRLSAVEPPRDRVPLEQNHRPVYLRTDFVFGLKSGGSVGHIAGVLNHLGDFCGQPWFITTDRIPTVRSEITLTLFEIDPRFREFRELPLLNSNRTQFAQAESLLRDVPVAFIYQRYSLHNFVGLQLAQHKRVPFVLEFNGSEVWVAKNWTTQRLGYEALAERIELANLRGADLVVVVSQPLKDTLVAQGVDPTRVLVNPNGVDTDRYAPTIDGTEVRSRYGLIEKTVIGFIGTFGPWHGAEVLADAFGRLLAKRPELQDSVRLLLVGDGNKMPEVRTQIAKHRVSPFVVLTGTVPQADGPAHLAAMDILASPHVPNSDGTKFFGSPTKLFEYMAMGKGIVASHLEQIGEILRHDDTAWMVRPADTDDLVRGLESLIDDSELRYRLGRRAREVAIARHTWRAHTQTIVSRLAELCR